MLIELTSANKVQAHSTAGGNAVAMFALEDELQGNGINDAYAANDKVSTWVPNSGDQALAILVDGENVSVGDFVESNGAGLLQKYTADTASSAEAITVLPKSIVGQVVAAAVDLSDSSGAESSGPLAYDKRVKIRIV